MSYNRQLGAAYGVFFSSSLSLSLCFSSFKSHTSASHFHLTCTWQAEQRNNNICILFCAMLCTVQHCSLLFFYTFHVPSLPTTDALICRTFTYSCQLVAGIRTTDMTSEFSAKAIRSSLHSINRISINTVPAIFS